MVNFHTTIRIFFFIYLGISSAQASYNSKILLALNVMDDQKKSIEGAEIVINYNNENTSEFTPFVYLNSDQSGIAFNKSTIKTPAEVVVAINKTGYYPTTEKITIDFTNEEEARRSESKQIIVRQKCTLKPIKQPIPLHVHHLSNREYQIPLDSPIGFDLLKGDLLPPHGQGETIDFFIKISRTGEREKFGEKTQLSITFPHKADGLSSFTFKPELGSHLKSKYLAPGTQYVSHLEKESIIRQNEKLGNIHKIAYANEGAGAYFRTRTQINQNMEIIDAHYSKMYGDIIFEAKENMGVFRLGTTYFNPTALDTNLEFDFDNNLSKNFVAESVTLP